MLSFPPSPSLNEVQDIDGRSWQFDGVGWGAVTSAPSVSANTGTSYTAQAKDASTPIVMSSSSPSTVTIPSGVFPLGASLAVVQYGTGQVTLVGATGVTLNPYSTLVTAKQYAVLYLLQILTDVWVVGGAST